MICVVCRHEWCWLCGLPYQSWVHVISIGGLICEGIASLGFMKNQNVVVRVLAIIGLYLGLPVIIIPVCILAGLFFPLKMAPETYVIQ
jgi:hypothetical protein